jgi:hypothetical protein
MFSQLGDHRKHVGLPTLAGCSGRRDAILFLLAAFPRLVYLLLARPNFDGPYWLLSESLLKDGSLALGGVKTTDFEAGYPWFLAVLRLLSRNHVFIVQLIQIAVSAVGAILLYRLVKALTGSAQAAIISAVLYAADPLLVKQAVGESPFVLVTPLLIAFAYAFVATKTTVGAAGIGMILGVLVMIRTMTLPLVACAVVLLLADRRPRAAVATLLIALLVIVPLALRPDAVNGPWWPTRSGLNLFLGNSPYTSALIPQDDADVLEPFAETVVASEQRRLFGNSPPSERDADSILRRRALAYIREQPLRAIQDKAWNVFHSFWPPLVPYYLKGANMRVSVSPSGEITVENHVRRPLVEVVAYSASYSLVLAAALVGLFVRRHLLRRDAVLLCIMMTFVAVHAVYFPATRYRGPVSVVLIIYASVAFDRLGSRQILGS